VAAGTRKCLLPVPPAGSYHGNMDSSGQGAVSAEKGVTVIVARRVRPGAEADFQAWAAEASAAAAKFPGHMGATLQLPDAASGPEHVLVFRFASLADLRRWEQSDERRHYLERAVELTEGDPNVQLLTGMEGWFVPPPHAVAPPPRYKMAIVTGAAIFPLVVGFNALVAPLLEPLPPIWRTLLATVFLVTAMTYLVMPPLSRLLRGWLYAGRTS
jgi:uncharacterized protein